MVDSRIIKDAVRLACRAPSLHNSQPWRVGGRPRRPAAVPRPDAGRAVHRPFRARGDHQLRCGARSLARRDCGRGLVQHRRPVPQSEQPRSPGHGQFPADGLCHRRPPPSRRRDPRCAGPTGCRWTAPPDWEAVELMLRAGLDDRDLSDVPRRGRQAATGPTLPSCRRRCDCTIRHITPNCWWTALSNRSMVSRTVR